MPNNNAICRLLKIVLCLSCASPAFALYNNGCLIACPGEKDLADTWLVQVIPPLEIRQPEAPKETQSTKAPEIDAFTGEIRFPSLNAQDTTFDVPETDFSHYGKAFGSDK
ncbi:hypothetical protein [Cerasicoccus fimbriatus]|uniref:hypothetical protein n=1 Tax=Cerasicoccus fimbriatus TaxID=3014554 RepID=UPI0022B586DD|nr:hypothetical protein [Cerasicoccus sp. TK19100]